MFSQVIRRTYRYRIYPTRSQVGNLENQFSMCRHLYNWMLQDRIEAHEKGQKLTYNIQQNQLPELKIAKPWYKGVHSQVLQYSLRRLDRAYQNFFRRAKAKHGKAGFPRFKKRGQWNSITYPQYRHSPIDGTISVPKVGDVKINLHRDMPEGATVKTLEIVKDGGKWFACFSLELPTSNEREQQPRSAIGIDLGLKSYFARNDGDKVDHPRWLKHRLKHLAKLQRRFAKTKKGSPQRQKLLIAIQRCHYRIKCSRLDWLHKKANELVDQYDVICVEKLNIKGMLDKPEAIEDGLGGYLPNGAWLKSQLNRSILDASWSKFVELVSYKAESLGKIVIAVDPRGTTIQCSECGTAVPKELAERVHRCPNCAVVLDRDVNASRNILSAGLRTLAQMGIDASTIATA